MEKTSAEKSDVMVKNTGYQSADPEARERILEDSPDDEFTAYTSTEEGVDESSSLPLDDAEEGVLNQVTMDDTLDDPAPGAKGAGVE
jgi:hypothetical protein